MEFERTGVKPLVETYQAVVDKYDIDTIVLIDGGTDSIIRGDEALLGTIEEDALSIVAVNQLSVPTKLLACLGFGIDQYHGICHHSFLENTSEIIRDDGFLGCVSVLRETPEGQAFLNAVEFLNKQQPSHLSIVSNCIASAIRGEFGNQHASNRTSGSELFVNPLMSMYWCYDVPSVASKMGFHKQLSETNTLMEVVDTI